MIVKLIREGLGRVIIFFDWITRPRKKSRTPEQQAEITQTTKNMSLYQFHACPFCIKTRRAMHRLNLPIELRDATKGSPHREELINGGGAAKVPCLRIDENGQTKWMYESNEIITYLETQFA